MASELEGQPFSFYPAIEGIDHNEWTLVEETWAELVVRNTREQFVIGIPRRVIGEVSHTDHPVRIVGLKHVLEYKAGQVWPVKNSVFTMPAPPGTPMTKARKEAPPPPLKTGLGAITGSSQGAENKVTRLIVGVLAGLAFVSIAVVAVVKLTPGAKPIYSTKDQSFVVLSHADDYYSILRKVGKPTEEAWKEGATEIQYRRLTFKDRGYSLILMGKDQDSARYIGTMNAEWKPIHSVELGRNANSSSMLRALPKF